MDTYYNFLFAILVSWCQNCVFFHGPSPPGEEQQLAKELQDAMKGGAKVGERAGGLG